MEAAASARKSVRIFLPQAENTEYAQGNLQAGHHQQIQVCRLNIKQLPEVIVGQAALVKIYTMPQTFVRGEQLFDAAGIA